jgi:hypothetical protein
MPHGERTPSKNENLMSFPSPLMGEGVGEGEPIVPLTSILSTKGRGSRIPYRSQAVMGTIRPPDGNIATRALG